MDAEAELQPGEPGRAGLVYPGVASAGARPENLFQETVEGEHRSQIHRLSEPPGVPAGELVPAEAGEQIGRGRLDGAVLALEVQAAGEVPHPGRDKREQAAICAQRADESRPENLSKRVVADPGNRVAGGGVDWPERGGQRLVEQPVCADQLSHAGRRTAQEMRLRRG